MSKRSLRKRIPVHRGYSQPHSSTSPSPSTSRRIKAVPDRSLKPSASRPAKILTRCNSEPVLLKVGVVVGDHRNMMPPEEFALYRPQTCADIFSSADSLLQSPRQLDQGYNRDTKVVVNITVEGSPGPIRTMVKLGSSVDETIRLVINKYCEEGRTPLLDINSTSAFELHHSYFSLQSLNKSEVIGDVGSRSFYLRRNNGSSCNSAHSSSRQEDLVSDSFVAAPNSPHSSFFLTAFVARKLSKIARRTHKLWKLMGCLSCS